MKKSFFILFILISHFVLANEESKISCAINCHLTNGYIGLEADSFRTGAASAATAATAFLKAQKQCADKLEPVRAKITEASSFTNLRISYSIGTDYSVSLLKSCFHNSK